MITPKFASRRYTYEADMSTFADDRSATCHTDLDIRGRLRRARVTASHDFSRETGWALRRMSVVGSRRLAERAIDKIIMPRLDREDPLASGPYATVRRDTTLSGSSRSRDASINLAVSPNSDIPVFIVVALLLTLLPSGWALAAGWAWFAIAALHFLFLVALFAFAFEVVRRLLPWFACRLALTFDTRCGWLLGLILVRSVLLYGCAAALTVPTLAMAPWAPIAGFAVIAANTACALFERYAFKRLGRSSRPMSNGGVL